MSKKGYDGNMFKNLPPIVYRIFSLRLIFSFGCVVYPFLTLYLTQKMEMSEMEAGQVIFITVIGGVLGGSIGALVSDLIGRKKVLITGILSAGLIYSIVPFLSNIKAIISCIIMANSFYAMSEPAFNALIADVCENKFKKKVFSFMYIATNIGFSIGSIIAGLIFNNHYKLIFFGEALFAMTVALLSNLWLTETTYFKKLKSKGPEMNKVGTKIYSFFLRNSFKYIVDELKIIAKIKGLIFFAIVYILHTFIYSQVFFCIPIFLNDLYFENGPQVYGLIMSINGISIIFLSSIVTKLFISIRPFLCVAYAGIFYAVGFGIYSISHNIVLLILGTVIWSFGEILSVSNSRVFILEKSPIYLRAKTNVLLDYSYEAGYSIGPLVMGAFIIFFGIKKSFILISFLSITSTVILGMYFVVSKKIALKKLYHIKSFLRKVS